LGFDAISIKAKPPDSAALQTSPLLGIGRTCFSDVGGLLDGTAPPFILKKA
jgi:hypothetical protein